MMERDSNSRTRRTKAALRASLAALIQEKGLADVTVRELAARAGVNRATFYIHYHDIADLLNQTHCEILSDLFAVLEAHREEENAERPLAILCDVFRFLQKHSAICAALLGERLEASPCRRSGRQPRRLFFLLRGVRLCGAF